MNRNRSATTWARGWTALIVGALAAGEVAAAITFDDSFTGGSALVNDGVGGDWTEQSQGGGFRAAPIESGGLATLSDGNGTWNIGMIRTNQGFKWGGSTVTVVLNELLFPSPVDATDYGAGFPWEGHAMISLFDSANTDGGPGAYNNHALPALSIEIGDDGSLSGFVVHVPGSSSSEQSYAGGGVFDSFIEPGNPLEVTIATNFDGSFSVAFNQSYGGGLTDPIAGNLVGGLGVPLAGTFDLGLGTQGVGDTEMAAVYDRATVDELPFDQAPVLNINRQTGAISLVNTTGATIALKGYRLASPSGTLNPLGWNPITGTRDGSGTGSIDNDPWTISMQAPGELAESSAGTADFVVAQEIPLGTAVLPSAFEDVTFTYTLDGVTYLEAQEEYVGSPLELGDFNADGAIGSDDWSIFVQNFNHNPASTTIAQASRLGDMNGDVVIRIADFELFAAAYADANPGAAPLTFPVPEPASLGLLAVAGALWSLRRRTTTWRMATPRIVLTAALGLALATAPASATVFLDDDFNDGNLATNVGGVGNGFIAHGQDQGSAGPPFVANPHETGGLAVLQSDPDDGYSLASIVSNDTFTLNSSGILIEYFFSTLNSSTLVGMANQSYNPGPANGGSPFHPAFGIPGALFVDADAAGQVGGSLSLFVTDTSYSVNGGPASSHTLGSAMVRIGASYQGPAGTSSDIERIRVSNVSPVLKLRVNTTTGSVTIINETNSAIALNGYEIESPLGSLSLGSLAGDYTGDLNVNGSDFALWQRTFGQSVTPSTGADGNGNGVIDAADLTVWRGGYGATGVAGGWTSLHDQGLNAAGPGQTQQWIELGVPSSSLVAEAFLTGSTPLATNSSVSLGSAFKFGGQQDLQFRYTRNGESGTIVGSVEYVSGSVAAIPEPASWALAALAVAARRRLRRGMIGKSDASNPSSIG